MAQKTINPGYMDIIASLVTGPLNWEIIDRFSQILNNNQSLIYYDETVSAITQIRLERFPYYQNSVNRRPKYLILMNNDTLDWKITIDDLNSQTRTIPVPSERAVVLPYPGDQFYLSFGPEAGVVTGTATYIAIGYNEE